MGAVLCRRGYTEIGRYGAAACGNLTRRKNLKLSPVVTEDFYYDALNRFDKSERTPAGGPTSTNADVTLAVLAIS